MTYNYSRSKVYKIRRRFNSAKAFVLLKNVLMSTLPSLKTRKNIVKSGISMMRNIAKDFFGIGNTKLKILPNRFKTALTNLRKEVNNHE